MKLLIASAGASSASRRQAVIWSVLIPVWAGCTILYWSRGQLAAAVGNGIFTLSAPLVIVYWLWRSKRERQRERTATGLCLSCGYDCRVTPSRCPECGAQTRCDGDRGVPQCEESMAKKRERKMRWKNFVFTPRDADPVTHGIRYRDDGFLYLCLRLRNGDYLGEYDVHDAKFRPGDGGRSVATDWTGFYDTLRKHEAMNPKPPSVFSGRYQHSEEGKQLRTAVLRSIVREYQHPEALADDLWAWLKAGKPDETWNFIRLLALYWNEAKEHEKAKSSAIATTQV